MEIFRDPIGLIRRECRKLMELRDPPHAIALGIAVGVFWGFTPLWGLKTLLTLASAVLLRANRVAALVSVSLHDVLLPLMPIVIHWEFLMGKAVLGWFGVEAQPLPLHGLHVRELLQWTTFLQVGEPMLIGSILVAIPASLVTYAAALPFFLWRATRRESVG